MPTESNSSSNSSKTEPTMKPTKKYLARFYPQLSIELPEDWHPGKDADWDTARATLAEAIDKLSSGQLTDLLLENLEEVVPDTEADLNDNEDTPEAMLQKLNLQRLSIQWQMRELIAKHDLTIIVADDGTTPQQNTPDSEHIAERNGHAAWVQFVASKMRPNCPYPKGSVQETAWKRGWNKA